MSPALTQRLEQSGPAPDTRKRRAALEWFRGDRDPPPGHHHLGRGLRVIPMDGDNWNLCWTKVGAEHPGTMQSPIVTGRWHGIEPDTDPVDVRHRVPVHPASWVLPGGKRRP